MTTRANCWEVKQCGRQPGGENVSKLGVCPASVDSSADGLNGGKNAGRICWAIAGTFCGDKKQGTFADKRLSCLSCDFYRQVQFEEDAASFMLLKPGQTYHPTT